MDAKIVFSNMIESLLEMSRAAETSPAKLNELSVDLIDLHNDCDNSSFLYFNPRNGTNMPVKEKVISWIKDVPYHLDEFDQVLIDCYSGIIEYSSSDSDNSDGAIDLSEKDQIMELQARRVTRYATRVYNNEDEPMAGGENESYIETVPEEMACFDNIIFCGPQFLKLPINTE